LFWDKIKYRWQKSAYDLKLDPQADPLSVYQGNAIRLPETGTYLYPNMTELVELLENNKSYQVIQRVPIESYGFLKEDHLIRDNSLEIMGDSVWFSVAPKGQGTFSQVIVEQQWLKPGRPYNVYQIGDFSCYALDISHRRIFLFPPNLPIIQEYDLSNKKIAAEYRMKTEILWGEKALYDPLTDFIVVESKTQYGDNQIYYFDPSSGQFKMISKGSDIQQGPNKTIFFMCGKKLYQYELQMHNRMLVYSAPFFADPNPAYWVGQDPSYIRFHYCKTRNKFNLFCVNIDLHHREFQVTQFDWNVFRSKYPSKEGEYQKVELFDDSLWGN
jgi:hypothetical protein